MSVPSVERWEMAPEWEGLHAQTSLCLDEFHVFRFAMVFSLLNKHRSLKCLESSSLFLEW